MSIYDAHAAKTHHSKLIEQACTGEEVVIARDNEPVVKLVAVQAGPSAGAVRSSARSSSTTPSSTR